MAAILTSILGGNGLKGAADLVNAIKGKSPEDAAKLAQINADVTMLQMKYGAEFNAAQEQHDADSRHDQAAINVAEATNGDKMERDWRPFIGWVCGFGLLSQLIVRPWALFVAHLCNRTVDFPNLDMGTLMTVLLGILGLGYYRNNKQ